MTHDQLQNMLPDLLYALGGATGLALGILYGLNGWRGSVKENPLQKSNRVKNLSWLLGTGAAAFLGDIHTISDQADKAALSIIYYLFAVIGAVCSIAFFAILIMVKTRGRWADYTALDALLDYLEFGYNYVREKEQELRSEAHTARGDNEELQDYLRQLTNSITIAGSKESMPQRITLARNLLRSINQIVMSIHPPSVTVRTNFMRVVDCLDEHRDRLLFVTDKAAVRFCLELVIYDQGVEPKDFRLPFEADPTRRASVLPGAPTALADSKPVVVDDTAKFQFAAETPVAVRESIAAYFRAQTFRSFASIPVVAGGRAIGVVNVEASAPRVFGPTQAETAHLCSRLMPFCAALGILLSD